MEELSQLELTLSGCNFKSSANIPALKLLQLFDHVCWRSIVQEWILPRESDGQWRRKTLSGRCSYLKCLLPEKDLVLLGFIWLCSLFIPNICPPVSPSVTGGVLYHVMYLATSLTPIA